MAKYSDTLEIEMKSIARRSERPEPRLRTIDRLVAACDAIEDQSGSDLIARQKGERVPRHGYEISPTNVDRYVRGQALLSKDWTGPVRVTIQRDPHYLEYVRARENERKKPKKAAKQGARAKSVDLALQSVLPIENRHLLVEEIDMGKKATRELQLLKQGLSYVPALDLDALLSGKPTDASPPAHLLGKDDLKLLRELVVRLADSSKLAAFGLALDRDRIVQAGGLGATLIKPTEFRLLKRLSHYNEIEAVPLDVSFERHDDKPD